MVEIQTVKNNYKLASIVNFRSVRKNKIGNFNEGIGVKRFAVAYIYLIVNFLFFPVFTGIGNLGE